MKTSGETTTLSLPWLRAVFLGAAGSMAAGLGLLGVMGWASGNQKLTTLGTGNVPISPTTSVLLLLLASAVLLRCSTAPSRWRLRGAAEMAAVGSLIAMTSLAAPIFGIDSWWEHLGFVATPVDDVPRVGHVLPASAVFFALAGMIFVVTEVPRFVRPWTIAVSVVGSLLLWSASVVFLFRYLMDAQPLVPTARVTPAFGTVLGMAPLSVALMLLASRFGTTQPAGLEFPRFLFGVFALLETVIVVAGSVYYNRFEQQFVTDNAERVVGILSAKAKRLGEWRMERLNDGAFYFDNPSFAARVRRLRAGEDNDKTRVYLHNWLLQSWADLDYDQFRLLDPEGTTLMSKPESLPPASTDTRFAAAAAIRAGEPLLQDLYWHERDGRPCMAVVVPIAESPEQPWLGTVVLRIDPGRRLFRMVREWPLPKESVEMVMIRRDGNHVSVLNAGALGGQAGSVRSIPLQKTDSVLVRATARPAGMFYGVDLHGGPALAAAQPVSDSPWTVVAIIDPVTLSAPLRERVWAVALLVAVGWFGIGAALSVYWRHQRARFLRERLEVAEALRVSEGRFRQVLETVSLIGVVLDLKGQIVLANDFLQHVSGWGAAELLGRNWFELFLPPEIRAAVEDGIFLKSIHDGAIPLHYENEIMTRSGERRLVAWNNTILRDAAGAVMGVASIGEDITERRRAETKLVESLREKEALLKEVHHRVKNNLQVVASLLRLESGRSEHVLTKYVLQEMHGRIRAMALLHESLYRTTKFDRIDLAAYLRQLLAYLGRSLGSAAGTVQFEEKLEPVEVSADEAIPCGLITNELVTNSVKHGFPNGGAGRVTVELRRVSSGGEVQLRVSDNGVGLPPGFDPAKVKSLGMQLVDDLTRQLGGRLEVGPGAMFTVFFKVGPAGSIDSNTAATTPLHA